MAGRQTQSSSKKFEVIPEEQLCCVSCLSLELEQGDGAETTEMKQHNAEGKAEKTQNQVLGKDEHKIILLNSFFKTGE